MDDDNTTIDNRERDLLDSVKGFLAIYLNQILDDPDQLIKLAIQERDEELKSLKKELDEVKNELAILRSLLEPTPIDSSVTLEETRTPWRYIWGPTNNDSTNPTIF